MKFQSLDFNCPSELAEHEVFDSGSKLPIPVIVMHDMPANLRMLRREGGSSVSANQVRSVFDVGSLDTKHRY